MDKNEIIFFAAIIVAYIVCTLTLNIPMFVQIIFGIVLLVVLIAAIILKYQQKIENEKISHIAEIMSIILFIIFAATMVYETWFNKTLPIDSSVVFVLFLSAILCRWIFKKKVNKS